MRGTAPTGCSVAGLTETSSGIAVVAMRRIVLGILGRDPIGDPIEVGELRGDPARKVVLADVRARRLETPVALEPPAPADPDEDAALVA